MRKIIAGPTHASKLKKYLVLGVIILILAGVFVFYLYNWYIQKKISEAPKEDIFLNVYNSTELFYSLPQGTFCFKYFFMDIDNKSILCKFVNNTYNVLWLKKNESDKLFMFSIPRGG